MPTTDTTVTQVTSSTLSNPAGRQRIDVCDIHCSDWHAADATDVEAVVFTYPKFNPNNVTDAPPVSGIFLSSTEANGASKLSMPRPVPTVLLNVTETARLAGAISCGVSHLRIVDDCHDTLWQIAAPSCTDGVDPLMPKCRPASVTDALPVCGMFRIP